MQHEIIDFHTHPFTDPMNNICAHQDYFPMSPELTVSYLQGLGISKICGTVLCCKNDKHALYATQWDAIADSNNRALALKEQYGDFYIPGFHVHPDYVEESCREIERMHKLGIRLIGELTPYLHGWSDYTCDAFDEILDVATSYNMIVNFHRGDEDAMDTMVKKHPDTILIAAHPGEFGAYTRHLNRMKMSENYYLDLSGTGLFRHGMLRRGIAECGVERFIFGSDYPTCNPAMLLGGVLLDTIITEEEKAMVLAGNAKRLLGL